MLLALGVAAILGSGLLALWVWGGSGRGEQAAALSSDYVRFEVEAGEDTASVAARLQSAGLLGASNFRWYKQLYHPFSTLESGVHWLPAQAPARALVRLLARLPGRPARRVSIPEGWDSFQIAGRLAEMGICPAAEFSAAALALQPGVPLNHEGYLYPASYDFSLNTPARVVTRRLNREAKLRIGKLLEERSAAVLELQRRYQLSPEDVVTLASMVQKEAADASEFGNIASVFLNRLSDTSFRPRRMLQSDPTAGYGCKLPHPPPSCAGYRGRITPALIRDPANRYNTYRNAGLPPGPIGNPSVDAILAVLAPPTTNYLFFVGHNGGRHTFSRTLKEHQAAIKNTK